MIFKTLVKTVKSWQQQGEIVVLVTGVFDVLHIEHFRFLSQAKKAGTRLIVGIERDSAVKQIKGPTRPIYSQTDRLEQVSLIKPVDIAFLLPQHFNKQSDWESFMDQLRPNIYAVSSHTNWLDNKQQIASKYQSQLKIVHQHNPQVSTSQVVKKIARDL